MKKSIKIGSNKDNNKDNNKSDSYLALSRRKRRKKLLKFGIPIMAVIAAFGIFAFMQAQDRGIGAPMVSHIHPNLTLVTDGNPTSIPENIGMDQSLYNDRSLDKYGMSGMAPLHTHDSSGTIHVESNANRNSIPYTLGDFFNVWGLDLEGKTIKVIANGNSVPDFRSHKLKDGENIVMEIT